MLDYNMQKPWEVCLLFTAYIYYFYHHRLQSKTIAIHIFALRIIWVRIILRVIYIRVSCFTWRMNYEMKIFCIYFCCDAFIQMYFFRCHTFFLIWIKYAWLWCIVALCNEFYAKGKQKNMSRHKNRSSVTVWVEI